MVVAGGPDLRGLDPVHARESLHRSHDLWRRAIACEPRGSEIMVGAYLLPATLPDCLTGVVFFNNVGYLGMCGHGLIGVVETMRYLGRIAAGKFRVETPAGVVAVELHEDNAVTIANVASYRHAHRVAIDVPGYGHMHGDVAWGGNWFFLVNDHGLILQASETARLMDCSIKIRRVLAERGISGRDGAEIDHIELTGASPTEGVDGRAFVLCPGLSYDRSPCGTGTSAKLACLAAEGRLEAGAVWRQDSIIGSEFQARYRHGVNGDIHPEINGRAHLLAETSLLFDADDRYTWGMP